MSEVLERLRVALSDRYAIEQKIGSGGSATVYLARDLKHERAVALKVFRPELTVVQDRFVREIKLAAGLRHPHILPVHDSGSADGLLYYVMPYVEGASLSDRIERETRLDLHEAVRIAGQVADALDYAHQHHVIHRDVKPANILLEAGHAVVTDFGIAIAIRARSSERLTAAGMAIGTPQYMSPEQIETPGSVDPRSDVYSLACVTFEMLTGVPPFDGPTVMAIMIKQLSANMPFIGSFRADVPDEVDTVITKALSSNASDRYETMGQFAQALATAARGGSSGVRSQKRDHSMRRSIAVLPFTNMSADSENEYFSDGITEDVINALSKVAELRVASRTSSFSFKGKEQDIRQIGKQLNVGTVLEGSVRQARNQLRVTAQLIDVTSGYHLWSDQYDREMDDVFVIQDDISRAIVEKLTTRLVSAAETKLVTQQTESLDAYNHYLRGRYFWTKRGSGLLKAKECFAQAIAADPVYAAAHGALADTYSLLAFYRVLAPKDAFPIAKDAARRAIELDKDMGEAHTSLAFPLMYYDWAWEDAEREFLRAMKLNPRHATTHHWYAEYLMAMGRIDEAISHSKVALEIDPLGLIIHVLLGMAYYFARRYEESIAECHRILEMHPEFTPVFIWLGLAHLQLEQFDASVQAFQKESELSPERPTTTALLAVAHALRGDEPEARTLLTALVSSRDTAYVSSFDIALIHFALGEDDAGFEWLGHAYDERACWLAWLRVDPLFDRVRDDERFKALLTKMGLG